MLQQSFLRLTRSIRFPSRAYHDSLNQPADAQYRNLEQATSFYDSVIDRVRSLPVSGRSVWPTSFRYRETTIAPVFVLKGVNLRRVSICECIRDWWLGLRADDGIRLLRGRLFTEADPLLHALLQY